MKLLFDENLPSILCPHTVIPTAAARFSPPRRIMARRAVEWRDPSASSCLAALPVIQEFEASIEETLLILNRA